MARITITLSDEEKKALMNFAQKEFREPHQQAALIIRQELEAQGLLPRRTIATVTTTFKGKAGKSSTKNNLITTEA